MAVAGGCQIGVVCGMQKYDQIFAEIAKLFVCCSDEVKMKSGDLRGILKVLEDI